MNPRRADNPNLWSEKRDSIQCEEFVQTDHRQGRDASRRSGDCLPRRRVAEEGRSRRLNGGNGFSEIEGKAARVAAREGGSQASFNGTNGMSDIEHARLGNRAGRRQSS